MQFIRENYFLHCQVTCKTTMHIIKQLHVSAVKIMIDISTLAVWYFPFLQVDWSIHIIKAFTFSN